MTVEMAGWVTRGVASFGLCLLPAAVLHGPNASFTTIPTTGPPPLTVNVDASASTPSHGSILSYSWDWGDGSPEDTGVTASHLYASTGTFTITLLVRDAGGGATATQTVECLTAGNARPTAQIVSATPSTGSAPLDVVFTGQGQDPAPAGDVLEHRWDFGDGSPPAIFSGLASGATSTPTHTYANPGSYLCTLRVTDSEGILDAVTAAILVTAQGVPVASFTVTPASGPPPLSITVDASASFDSGGSIVDYFWDWGDGTQSFGGPLSSHTYFATGTFTILLRVTDDSALTATTPRSVDCLSVGNVAPTSHIQGVIPDGGPAPVEVTFVGHSHDDTGPLDHRWDFGDGSPPAVYAGVANHANTTPSHVYLHPGTYTCTLRVKDPENVLAFRSISVVVGPSQPEQLGDGACGGTGGEILLGMLLIWLLRRRYPR